MGGHSGAEIDKNRANANSLLGTFLYGLKKKAYYELISVQGGQKDNAITRESTAELMILKEDLEAVKEYCAWIQQAWREEYAGTDEGITDNSHRRGRKRSKGSSSDKQGKVVFYLKNVPFGVQKMSGTIPGTGRNFL